jgi:RNA polymerase sigma-70 factor (ECF subfamily)
VRPADTVSDLVRDHSATIQRLITRLVGRTPDVEDLVQMTFAEAVGSMPRYQGRARLSTWLCGIAVHVAHHHLRARQLRRHLHLDPLLEGETCPEALIAGGRQPDEVIDRDRLLTKLQDALCHLAPSKRSALILYVMAGLSVAEIAASTNATATATRSRMFFARRELRKAIRSDPQFRELAATVLHHGV